MGDAAQLAPRVPTTCAQNAILSLLIIHIIPSRQIYVAIDNPLLVPSISCLTTSCDLLTYVSQPGMFPRLKTCKAMAAGAVLPGTNGKMGSKFPEFSGIVVSARAKQ